jgi:glycosyltransferase involved in cell wall biosynthesis
MKKQVRVMLLSPYPLGTGSSLRYRWEQYISVFEAAGISLDVRGFQSLSLFRSSQYGTARGQRVAELVHGYLRRWRDVHEALSYDLVIVQREATPFGPPLFERWLARRNVPLVYDFDDALYVPAGRWIRRLAGWSQKIGEIISLSLLTIAGNPILAHYARQHSQRVVVVPTVPNPEAYTVPQKAEQEGVIVGWSGSRLNTDALNLVIGPLRQLQERYGVELWVAGDSNFRIEGLRASGVDWTFPLSDRQVWDALQPMDVGLMPLADTPWNRGKCGFKALLYMSMGIPPVVSPVGINAEIIEDGLNGFLAHNEAEWHAKLEALVASSSLRKEMGRRARQTVERKWSALLEAPRLIQLIKETAYAF